jgi:hypothetical protein
LTQVFLHVSSLLDHHQVNVFNLEFSSYIIDMVKQSIDELRILVRLPDIEPEVLKRVVTHANKRMLIQEYKRIGLFVVFTATLCIRYTTGCIQ